MLKSTENNWMNSRLLCIKSKELIDSNPLPLFSIEKSNQFSLFYLLLLTITMLVNYFFRCTYLCVANPCLGDLFLKKTT